MHNHLPMKAFFALILSIHLAGAAGAAPGDSRRFAGFYQVGRTVRVRDDVPGGDARVVLHLRIFNFGSEDLTQGTLRVGAYSTPISLAGHDSLRLDLELPAGGAELDAWTHGVPPRVSLQPDSGAVPLDMSLIPMRVAADDSPSGSRRKLSSPAALSGSPTTSDVTTVAGGGPSHVPATTTALGLPYHLAIDSTGNLQIADIQKNRIFRVNPADEMTITAGTGKGTDLDMNGDGGMAVDAIFGRFSGLATGPDGEVVSFEWGYQFGPDETEGRIRRIDPGNGRISSVITGYPFSCPSFNPFMAGGIYDSTGSLLFIDQGCGYVWRVDAVSGQPEIVAGNGGFGFSGDGGPATSASLTYPSSLAIDGDGNLFIGDAGSNRIRRVDGLTRTITTVAGNGHPGDDGDGGPALEASLRVSSLTLDPAGNILFVDTEANRVRRIDATTGIVTPFAGTGEFGFSGDGGPATAATLAFPFGIVSDPAGNVFVTDLDNKRVRRVDALNGRITTFAGGGGMLTGDGGPAVDAELAKPTRVALNADDELFIVTGDEGRIRRVDPVTGVISTVAMIPAATDADQDAAGNLFVAQAAHGNEPARVVRVDVHTGQITTVAGGGTSADDVPATQTHLGHPTAIEVDAGGNLFIADRGAGSVSGTVRKIDAVTRIITTVAGGGPRDAGDGLPANRVWLDSPSGIALDAAGNLFIAEESNGRIRRVDATTMTITTVAGVPGGIREGNTGDGGPATDAGLANPTDVVVDAHGDIYLSTKTFRSTGQYTGRVRRIDANTGIIDSVAEALGTVTGLAADRRGNIFFVDSENRKVRRLNLASRRPTASATADATAECGMQLTLDGSGSTDADSTSGTNDDIVSYEWYEGLPGSFQTALGTGERLDLSLPRGVHHITLMVTDSQGERSTDSLVVDVRDTLAPTVSVELNRSILTPPNHRMVDMRATVSATDLCGATTFRLKSITSNEPEDSKGRLDGKTPRDIAKAVTGTADTRFALRAERSNLGTGRIYSVVYEAIDAAGNTTTATALVTVPLDY